MDIVNSPFPPRRFRRVPASLAALVLTAGGLTLAVQSGASAAVTTESTATAALRDALTAAAESGGAGVHTGALTATAQSGGTGVLSGFATAAVESGGAGVYAGALTATAQSGGTGVQSGSVTAAVESGGAGISASALTAAAGRGPAGVQPGAAAGAVAAESSPIGFGAGTTGGAGGSTVTVTTYAQLVAEAKSADRKTIRISGIITGSNETILVTSNKTIIGVGADSGVVNGGFFVKKATNVILRNMKISLAKAPVDLIQIQKSDHVWVDHNELFNDTSHDKDFYDGLLDVNHGSDFITVSWNRLHDHFKGSLVGHSDKNAAEDTGKLRVTYGHNWFEGVQARLPRVRFGTVHSYNNFFGNAVTSGIHCLMGAQCLVQNNVFRGVTLPIWTTQDSPVDGFAVQNGNDFGGAAPVITQVGSFTEAPYAVTLEPAASVESTVKSQAGTGKVG